MNKIVVAITGASGSIYGKTLCEELLKKGFYVSLIFSEKGKQVFAYETKHDVEQWIETLKGKYDTFTLESNDDLFAGPASGSHRFSGMVICPCSMGTLAEIANGITKNLMTRAADVCLKERRPLVLVPRETPLNSIHLNNMLTLSNIGATILPAMPGFYHHPTDLDDIVNFVVGKILDRLRIDNNLFNKWKMD